MLDAIVGTKRRELAALQRDAAAIRERAESRPPGASFADALRARSTLAVIAEVKRRSPSAGDIREDAAAEEIARAYAKAGAAAISVLTDREHFGGSLGDLETVSEHVGVPLLRKDFTLHPLQVYEARAAGASAVLLIVRLLDVAELSELGALAHELGMSALVEVHDEDEVGRALLSGARIIGVNNRDLATFTTDLAVTERLAALVPASVLLVGESGIRSAGDAARLAAVGVDAVLVGEALMRAGDPAAVVSAMSAVPRAGR